MANATLSKDVVARRPAIAGIATDTGASATDG